MKMTQNIYARRYQIGGGAVYILVLMILFACDRSSPPPAPESGLEEHIEANKMANKMACPESFDETELTDGAHTGFDTGREERSFYLSLPDGGPPTQGFPLLVAFHGTNESGQSFMDRANLGDFVDRQMIVVAPDAAGHGTIWPVWDAMRLPADTAPNLDLLYFDRLLDCLIDGLAIDDSRIFVAGHSAGGIMTNTVLRHRADVVAGGIPASGLFEFTGPTPSSPPESPLTVIITWGGDNDYFRGATTDGIEVDGFYFAEQAALASRFYDRISAVEQYHCRGENRGHVWLSALNDWKIDVLSGTGEGEPADLPRIDGVVTCSTAPADLPEPRYSAPECDHAAHPLCAETCAQFADCFLANATLGPVLSELTASLGISVDTCEPCIEDCRMILDADSNDEAPLLRCLVSDNAEMCGPGIKGALPLVEKINSCCSESPTSITCRQICDAVEPEDSAAEFLPVCR